MLTLSHEFKGTARYQVERRIGAGGMGVVYAVWDRERRSTVALKTLSSITPEWLDQFKREFRALADVSHPNLITYFELESTGGQWYFTMELVDGHDFLNHVRARSHEIPSQRSLDPAMSETIQSDDIPTMQETLDKFDKLDSDSATPALATLGQLVKRGSSPAHIGRLRAAGRQLAEGVHALHQAGQLHCDLKPSNVLVSEAGRVVILDFGLVTRLSEKGAGAGAKIAGTPLYMAPEQAEGKQLTEATDWYAIGTILYEALTGRRPFEGSHPMKILYQKIKSAPPKPSEVTDGVPPDLEQLVMDLLERDPKKRPAGPELMSRLGAAPIKSPLALLTRVTNVGGTMPFVGRKKELELLREAFAAIGEGHPSSVHIRGRSGVGKSSLVRRFLDFAERHDAVVLEGRCYERESLPYKALDSLVDGLARFLTNLPEKEAHAIVPPGAAALGRLFPVLRTVQVIAQSTGESLPDRKELRRAAFSALRTILARIAKSRSLILFIDDVQWGDEDSAPFLADLLRPPDAPNLLLLLAYRSDEVSRSPFLETLKRGDQGIVEIDLDALTPEDASSLAAEHIKRRSSTIDEVEVQRRAAKIASESRGIPFFVDVLSRAAITETSTPVAELSLDIVLLRSFSGLNDSTRKVLDILAVAGRPIPIEVVVRAAGLVNAQEHLSTLRAAQLIRVAGVGDQERVVTSHDRVREVAWAALMPKVLAQYHLALANAIEGSSHVDPEALTEHLRAAGENERAAKYAEIAAERAASTLAFERAAELYRLVLELKRHDSKKRFEILMKLAEVLSSAGQGGAAAEAFIEAAEATDKRSAIDVQIRAAEEFLISGRVSRGVAVVKTVLSAVGLKLASSPWRKILNIAFLKLRTKIRGLLNFKERPEKEVDPDLLTKIDVCWTIVRGMGLVDMLAGEEFALRGWLYALQAGEVRRLARAFPHRVGSTSVAPKQDLERTQWLVSQMEQLAERTDSAEAHGSVRFCKGLLGYFWGDFASALEWFRAARELLHRSAIGSNFEACTAACYVVGSLWYLGRASEAIRAHQEAVSHAEARGDRWSTSMANLSVFGGVHLLRDDPEAGRRAVAAAQGEWPTGRLEPIQLSTIVSTAQILLYEGRAAEAFKVTREFWDNPWRRLVLNMQFIRIEMGFVSGRAAIASAIAGQSSHLAIAEELAASLEKTGAKWAQPQFHLLRAGIASVREDRQAAIKELELAWETAEAAGLILFARAAERRRGELLGGDEGRAIVARVDSILRDDSVKNPEKLVGMIAPMKTR
jgi:eukaryotic-like serine/threonine-protein kinase